MAYFIFAKNQDNVEGYIYRIAENENFLNTLNIIKSDYKIIEDSQQNFEDVKCNIKSILKYNNNNIIFNELPVSFPNETNLKNYINNLLFFFETFIKNNPNYVYLNLVNDFYNSLKNLNTQNFEYPFNKTLEQYFKEENISFFNPLQLP